MTVGEAGETVMFRKHRNYNVKYITSMEAKFKTFTQVSKKDFIFLPTS